MTHALKEIPSEDQHPTDHTGNQEDKTHNHPNPRKKRWIWSRTQIGSSNSNHHNAQDNHDHYGHTNQPLDPLASP